MIKASDQSKDPVCLHAWSGTWHWGWGRGWGAEANHTLEFVDLSASRHKDSSVWGLEVSVSHSVSPTHDALEPGFTYPHLPVPFLCPSTSIWFSLLGWIYERLLFSPKPHRLRQKQRQSSLYRWHTNTPQENIPSNENTRTPRQNQTSKSLNTRSAALNAEKKELMGVSKIYIPSRASIGNTFHKSSLTAGYHANEAAV